MNASQPLPPLRRPGRLRVEIPLWQTLLFAALSIVVCFGIWAALTWGEKSEDRIISATKIPSPAETFKTFYPGLWKDRALARNTFASLRRVVLGFALATVVGVPIGILCGCFSRVAAFFAPLTIFGRNIPMAALIPLTFILFGIAETQKIMFIFLAAVAFIVFDSMQAIRDVEQRYIDTGYTLGAKRRQIILKVMVPLAMPNIFNSLRLLFGLAFGYIMLAEVIQVGGDSAGLGAIIETSRKRGPREHIYLVLMIIPIVALFIDRFLYLVQTQLFPFRFGGPGYLARAFKQIMYAWEDFRGLFWQPRSSLAAANVASETTASPEKPETSAKNEPQEPPAEN